MSPTNDLEDELLRRFQALKSTPTTNPAAASFKGISDDQARKAKEEDDELERIADGRPPPSMPKESGDVNNELARRMAKLKGVEFEVEIDDVDDDQEVNDFIASLSATTPTTLPQTKSSVVDDARGFKADAKNLETEAREALDATRGYADLSAKDKSDEEDAEEDAVDFETEDEILLRALEEAELDAETRQKNGKTRSEDDEEEVPHEKETEQDILARARSLATESKQPPSPTAADEPAFSFPSLPNHIPTTEDDNDDDDDKESAAKMALLLGLSGPNTKPGPSLPSPPKDRKPGQGWNLPGYKDDNDEDPDSWCCICNKDAEVICLGCEADPYCEECWVEGHVGERHRTKRFVRKGRKAVGA